MAKRQSKPQPEALRGDSEWGEQEKASSGAHNRDANLVTVISTSSELFRAKLNRTELS